MNTATATSISPIIDPRDFSDDESSWQSGKCPQVHRVLLKHAVTLNTSLTVVDTVLHRILWSPRVLVEFFPSPAGQGGRWQILGVPAALARQTVVTRAPHTIFKFAVSADAQTAHVAWESHTELLTEAALEAYTAFVDYALTVLCDDDTTSANATSEQVQAAIDDIGSAMNARVTFPFRVSDVPQESYIYSRGFSSGINGYVEDRDARNLIRAWSIYPETIRMRLEYDEYATTASMVSDDAQLVYTYDPKRFKCRIQLHDIVAANSAELAIALAEQATRHFRGAEKPATAAGTGRMKRKPVVVNGTDAQRVRWKLSRPGGQA